MVVEAFIAEASFERVLFERRAAANLARQHLHRGLLFATMQKHITTDQQASKQASKEETEEDEEEARGRRGVYMSAAKSLPRRVPFLSVLFFLAKA